MRNYRGTIKVVFATVVVVVVALAAYMLAQPDSKRPVTSKVRYAAPLTIAAAPVYIADAKGFWKDEGLDVDVTYFDSGRKALDALLSNDAEIMSVSETPPLRAYLSGSDIAIIGTVTKHNEAKMTVRSDKISKPADVRGKKIGTVAGTNSDYYMYRWLEANNIKVSEVEIVPLDATALGQAFVQGNVDVMFAWEPHNYNASSKIASRSKSWPTELYAGRHTVVMNSDYSSKHQDVAEKMLKGFIEAEQFIRAHPDAAKAIVRERTKMSSEALEELWKEYDYTVGIDEGLYDIIDDQSSWIASEQNPQSRSSAAGLVNVKFLTDLEPGRVGKK